MKSPGYDVRQFLKLACLAGTLTYAGLVAVMLIGGVAFGHIWISWPVVLLAYPLSVALFIIGPGLMWLSFRLLILISGARLRRTP